MHKAYSPQDSESDISKKWENARVFRAGDPKTSRTGKSFTVPIPPPNVTGQLHLGHAMMLVIQDIMTRYHRMKGDATLWLPGTDHAAIATETVVLKHLGIRDRNTEIPRERFLEECWKWTQKTHGTITEQVKKMGSSCDFSRERFTMDRGLSNAVNTIFTDLYNLGLIYRGERMINWSVGAQSVLADDEVNWIEKQEPFYHIKCGDFVIGTVRPETKCWHSPVVVNPNDERYKHLIGQEFEYETYAGKRKFTVLADEHVDPELGTGAMTISTAHDANDFEIAKRHGLDFPQKIDFDGRMTDLAGPCAGMKISEARKKSVEIMREKGLIVKEENNYAHRVPLCYRTGTVVEPMISKQWFIDVNKEFFHPILKEKTTLKKLTADAVRTGIGGKKVEIVPKRFEKTYFQWIDNLRDWCISRQIWWGHRIPVWYEHNGVGANCDLPETKNGEANPRGRPVGTGRDLSLPQTEQKIHLMHRQPLIFARHGESTGNAGKIFTADTAELTETGRKQAQKLAEQMKNKNITKIIASHLTRAQQTAGIVAEKLNLPIETWEDLREVECGNLVDQPIDPEKHTLQQVLENGTGESLEDLEKRAQKIWNQIEALDPQDGTVLLVGHGNFTGILQAVQSGVRPEYFVDFLQSRFHLTNCETHECTVMIPPKGAHLVQDEDTLDTWFSSALWPFSTLGWPDTNTPDFQNFFPTSVLETGHDIIFFWVARMIMFSTFAIGKVPFDTTYLHGMVCDEKGKKMSKSKGNGIDPLKMIEKFGTDALRMSMVVGTTPGNQVNLGEKKIEGYRNFANKLWNVARFILQSSELGARSSEKGDQLKVYKVHQVERKEIGEEKNMKNQNESQNSENTKQLYKLSALQTFDSETQHSEKLEQQQIFPQTLTERWILSKTQKLIQEVTDGIESHRYGEVGEKLYQFTWNDLADWAIEASKADTSDNTNAVLRHVLEVLLKLLHPYTPFVTEKIWEEIQKISPTPSFPKRGNLPLSQRGIEGDLKNNGTKDPSPLQLLATSPFPEPTPDLIDETAEQQFELLKDIITKIRSLRNEKKIEPKKKITTAFSGKNLEILKENESILKILARLEEISYENPPQSPFIKGEDKVEGISDFVAGTEIFIPLAGLVDEGKEKERLQKELAQAQKQLKNLEGRLSNKKYVENAPAHLVEETRAQYEEVKEKVERLIIEIGKYS